MNTARQFLAAPIQTGMLMPASGTLANAMVAASDIRNCRSIVEFGPGTGVVTEVIEKSRRPDSDFFSIELNENFVTATKLRCPDVTVYEDNAANLSKYLAAHQLENCDAIISSLPWSLINAQDQRKLLETILDSLADGGVFVTYLYVGTEINPASRRFKKLLGEKFAGQLTKTFVWNNLPPTRVFSCRKIAGVATLATELLTFEPLTPNLTDPKVLRTPTPASIKRDEHYTEHR